MLASWAYWDDVEPYRSPIPTAILDFLRTKSPPVRLYIWRCSLPVPRTPPAQGISRFPHISSIPTSNLIGFSMFRPFSRSMEAHQVLAELVTSSPHLESLELLRMSNKFSKRLPPIKHLSMNRSNWPYTADEVARIWDFSKLETLKITDRSHVGDILRSISSKSLPCLKRLGIEIIRGPPPVQDHFETIGRFLQEIPQLLEISLTTELSSLPITSITRHSSLRILSLKDRLWANGRGEVVGLISIPDLELLQSSCKHIAELTLDVRDCDASTTTLFCTTLLILSSRYFLPSPSFRSSETFGR
jgi:hypothetical protein